MCRSVPTRIAYYILLCGFFRWLPGSFLRRPRLFLFCGNFRRVLLPEQVELTFVLVLKFPEGINPRKTKEFKEEYKKQVNLFRKEHAAKIAAKKEKARAAQEAARQPAEEAAQ